MTKEVKRLFKATEIEEAKVEGVRTYTILDELFPSGVPKPAFVNITGAPDTGKSLLVKHITLSAISRKQKVLYITTEVSPSILISTFVPLVENFYPSADPDLLYIYNATWPDIDKLLEDIKNERVFAPIVVIDSLTGFYEAKEVQARTIVRRIYQFFHASKSLLFAISQKRSTHDIETEEAAGGLAVAHIADVNIIMLKMLADREWIVKKFEVNEGDYVRLIRVAGNRFGKHRSGWLKFKITEEGKMIALNFVKVE